MPQHDIIELSYIYYVTSFMESPSSFTFYYQTRLLPLLIWDCSICCLIVLLFCVLVFWILRDLQLYEYVTAHVLYMMQ